MKGKKTYKSYYSYVENVVNKCSHRWIINWHESLRDYSIERESNPNAKKPGGKLVKIFPDRCKSYSCPVCGKKKVMDLMDRLKRVDLKGYRFFTLTLKSKKNLDDTERNLKRITDCFNKLNKTLRKESKYKNLQYFRVIEIGKQTGMVHMHGIWNIYIPIGKLSTLWEKITGDSYRVDVRRVKEKSDCLNYLYKYLTKDVAKHNHEIDPSFFNMDLKTAAAIFYENGKRRYQASQKFFAKVPKKQKTGFLPYYYESNEAPTIESTISYLKNEYKLKKENFDLSCYNDSDLFLYHLFKPPE